MNVIITPLFATPTALWRFFLAQNSIDKDVTSCYSKYEVIILDERMLNVTFGKGGSGSVSCSFRIPKTWIDQTGGTPDDRQYKGTIDDEGKIILEKVKKPIDNDVTS